MGKPEKKSVKNFPQNVIYLKIADHYINTRYVTESYGDFQRVQGEG